MAANNVNSLSTPQSAAQVAAVVANGDQPRSPRRPIRNPFSGELRGQPQSSAGQPLAGLGNPTGNTPQAASSTPGLTSTPAPNAGANSPVASLVAAPAASSAVMGSPDASATPTVLPPAGGAGNASTPGQATEAGGQVAGFGAVATNPNAPAGEVGSVEGRLNRMLASDSPLMTRAATLGMQVANRRGLGNSSIAAGAAQNAVIEAAAPIAMQESQEANQIEITRMNNSTQMAIASADNETRKLIADKEIAANKLLAELNSNTQLSIADKRIAADQVMAQFERDTQVALTAQRIAADYNLADLDRNTRMELADLEVASREKLAALDNDTRLTIADKQIEAQRISDELARAQQLLLADKNIAADNARLDRTLAADNARLDRTLTAEDTRQQRSIEADNARLDRTIASNQQDRIAAALGDMSGQRFSAIANLNANPKLKAPARDQAMSSINDQFSQTMNYIQNLYGVKLDPLTPGKAA